ncbi:MAG: hypothetical protein G01um101420_343 [Parcubacteria group bacterium Gr01-1014_20]|nr:MAG: hypothetical protein G01um101420_343 [Parcubacteria group bacterium Gr01-1014_20]
MVAKIIVMGGVFVVVLIGAIFVGPTFFKKTAPPDQATNGGLLPLDQNNFSLPAGKKGNSFPESTFLNQPAPSKTEPNKNNAQSFSSQFPDFSITNLPETISNPLPTNIGNQSSPATTPNPLFLPTPKERFELPQVLMSELVVDVTGAKDFSTYMDQVILLSQNITFSHERFYSVSKEAGETMLFAEDLIDKALRENNFSKYKNSFSIMKEFSDYKISTLKGVKVTGDAVDINQKAVAFEKLKLELLGEAEKLADNKITRSDFDSYYKKYNNTAFYYLEQFKGKYSGLARGKDRGFWGGLADVFGLRKIAEAFLPLPFGGLIGITIPCPCSFGLSITVSPPVPGKFFISAFGSRIFPFFKPFPASWILGDYAATPMVCLEPAFPVCIPIDFSQGMVIIAGTSL